MSDDRLFASNNAIGRKWFFLNIIILIGVTFVSKLIFENFIFPDVQTPEYGVIAKSMLYILYAVCGITFLSLVDRRIYDVLGDREKTIYKVITAFIFLVVLFNAYVLCFSYGIIKRALIDADSAYFISIVLNFLFILLVFVIGTIKGRISTVSFIEYKRRIRYK